MKILINCGLPFALAHGGAQIQIERTMAALEAIGLQVEPLRWWDDRQTGDFIHYFGRMPADHIRLAQQKGLRVVMAELLTGPGSRSQEQLCLQKNLNRIIKRLSPRNFTAAFNWESYLLADAHIALTAWEAHLMTYLFDAPQSRVHVVANGVEDVFLNSPPTPRGKWLVCSATITDRKRVLELAEAAVCARTPIWIIGKAYAEGAPYAQRFFALARQHPLIIRYEGAINDRAHLAQIYREARGFVLLSTMESLSLSALEAAACECPLLLSSLPWAHTTFGTAATYCPVTNSTARTAAALHEFYELCPVLPAPKIPLYSWRNVAAQLRSVYEEVLSTSR
jgi:glycosyltransferase involved in cell wall biosynthesis